jgi:hypothetical protein
LSLKINPYRGLPSFQYWRSGVANVGLGQFDPVEVVKFQIKKDDLISTLGSCFAQHLALHIRKSGYNYMVTEPLRIDEEQSEIMKGTADQFSARYGNVYTVRQCLQLLERSLGWKPTHHIWEREGRFFDAFRPNVYPNGFISKGALIDERERHLKSVLDVFLNTDVIVFTLGLTEAWLSSTDGAVYPIAPGVVAGSMNDKEYAFKNFNYEEVRSDLEQWCTKLQDINPKIKILLTVSPVALNATYERQNVWTSTTYSKSVLRAAAGDVSSKLSHVDYFPSYEIITCPSNQGRYFKDDMREVKETGVRHVMRVFDRHYFVRNKAESPTFSKPENATPGTLKIQNISDIFCDEDLLDQN